ncbi:Retinoblastoma-related protein [Camellia lanceoleosa]|uniref:Retinoblastoma-related protein n=1 Tax=Camellia lanceoleosa TaxID=1840588 RepID=A0ACC0I9X1_9ERIC|nr:Retinoblastoma-related protein [Camellia lanceoleosa]
MVIVKVKGRNAVHESSGLQDSGHILEDGKSMYNTTLNIQGTGGDGFMLCQILRVAKLNIVDFFKELPQFIVKAGQILSNQYGTDWEKILEGVIGEVPGIILRCVSRDEAALAVAQKVFKGLYENASNKTMSPLIRHSAAIRDVSKLVLKELTSWVIYSDEDRKFNKDITIGLIHNELLNLAEYNVHMAKLIDAGRNSMYK